MSEVRTDERGRITIPESMRERFGERYRLVELHDGLKLVPVPDDPVAALEDAGSESLRAASMAELREAAHREGTDQAGR